MSKETIWTYLRRIGAKGGAARKKNLSPERRTEIARKAAKARWSKKSKKARTT
jgi:hypothetical protein